MKGEEAKKLKKKEIVKSQEEGGHPLVPEMRKNQKSRRLQKSINETSVESGKHPINATGRRFKVEKEITDITCSKGPGV